MKLKKLIPPLSSKLRLQERPVLDVRDPVPGQDHSGVDKFQAQEFDGELAFYEGMSSSSRFVTGMTAAGTVGMAVLSAGVALITAATLSPGLVLAGTFVGAAGLGYGAYLGGAALSDAVGLEGDKLDRSFPERGEAMARTGLAVGLSAVSGGVGGAIGTAAFAFGEGLITEGAGRVKHRLGRSKSRLMNAVKQYKQSEH